MQANQEDLDRGAVIFTCITMFLSLALVGAIIVFSAMLSGATVVW